MGIDWGDIGGFFKDWWPVIAGAGADLAIDLSVPDAPNMQYTPTEIDWTKYPELQLPEPTQFDVSQFGETPKLELPGYTPYQSTTELPAGEKSLLNKQFQPMFADVERRGKEASRRSVGAIAARGGYGIGAAGAAQTASRALTTQERTSLLSTKAQAALQRLDQWNQTQREEGRFAYQTDVQNKLNTFQAQYQDYWNKVSMGRTEQARLDEMNLRKSTAEYDAARAKVMDEAGFAERENVRTWEAEQTQKMLQYQATLRKFDNVSDMLANLVDIYMSQKNQSSFEDVLKNYFGEIPGGLMGGLIKMFGGEEGDSWDKVIERWVKGKIPGETGDTGDTGDGGIPPVETGAGWLEETIGAIWGGITTGAAAVAPYLPILTTAYGFYHAITNPPRASWRDYSDPQLAAAEAGEIYAEYLNYQEKGAPKLDKPLTTEEYDRAIASIKEMTGLAPEDELPANFTERDLRERLNQEWLEPISEEQWSQNIGLKIKPTWERLQAEYGGKLPDVDKVNWLWVIDQYGNNQGGKNPEVAMYRYIYELTGEKPPVRKNFGIDPYADYKKGDPDVLEIPAEEAAQKLVESAQKFYESNKSTFTGFFGIDKPEGYEPSYEEKKAAGEFSRKFLAEISPYYKRLKELNPQLPDFAQINLRKIVNTYGKVEGRLTKFGEPVYDMNQAFSSWLREQLTGEQQSIQSLGKNTGNEVPTPIPSRGNENPTYDPVLDPNSPNFDSIAFMQDLYKRTANILPPQSPK